MDPMKHRKYVLAAKIFIIVILILDRNSGDTSQVCFHII